MIDLITNYPEYVFNQDWRFWTYFGTGMLWLFAACFWIKYVQSERRDNIYHDKKMADGYGDLADKYHTLCDVAGDLLRQSVRQPTPNMMLSYDYEMKIIEYNQKLTEMRSKQKEFEKRRKISITMICVSVLYFLISVANFLSCVYPM